MLLGSFIHGKIKGAHKQDLLKVTFIVSLTVVSEQRFLFFRPPSDGSERVLETLGSPWSGKGRKTR